MNDIITPFTYAELRASVAAEVEAATTRIKNRIARLVPDIIETGRDLTDVKSKLEHGQFESWLNTSFNMTTRTAQKYMRAAEWMADKSELSSHLTPNTIYLLSAPSTPDSVQQQVLGDLEAGKPVNHREVREVVQEAKFQERQKKTAEQRKINRERRKRSNARREQEQRKDEEERQRRKTAAEAVAREVANILVNKLSKDEIRKVHEVLGDWDVTDTMLSKAITEAMGETRHSHGDTVVVFPPKPWAKS